MAPTPSVAVREAWASVDDAAEWAGVGHDLFQKVGKELGDPEFKGLRLVGGVSDEDYRSAVNRVEPAPIALQRSLVNILFNGVKVALGVPTLILQTLASPPTRPAASNGQVATTLMVADSSVALATAATPK